MHIKKSDDILQRIKENYKESKISCIQIFLNKSTSVRKLSKERKELLKDISEYCNEKKITIYAHAPYSLNIALSLSKYGIDWWIRSVIKELRTANEYGVSGVVLHVGKSLELDEKEGVENMRKSLKIIADNTKDIKTELLLETPAGQGTELLSNIDDFLNFYKGLSADVKKRVYVCIDTCHIFAAGYDLRDKKKIDDLFKKISDSIGSSAVHLIHFNDSELEFNSKRDRHADIGNGKIGSDALYYLAGKCLKNDIPILLETPSASPKTEFAKIKEF